MTAIVEDKIRVRAEALSRRASVPAVTRLAFASRLAEAGLAAIGPRPEPASTIVSVYHPIRGEADTASLMEALAGAAFITALPLTLGREEPLRFHLWRPGDPLARGNWNIPEPLPSAPLAKPDILFVPLAAFDRRGFRLGYGAGFYDNALARLRAQKPILAIGVAFGVQQVERVPCEPHDQRLDAIITENETLVFGPE